MKLSEVAEKVIELARKRREYYDVENPKYHPNYPVINLAEEGPPPPEEQFELRKVLESLQDADVLQLLLIMYLGRGDFPARELAENYEALRETFLESRHAVSQMMQKAPLADYVVDGLDELRKNRLDLDHLPLKDVSLAN